VAEALVDYSSQSQRPSVSTKERHSATPQLLDGSVSVRTSDTEAPAAVSVFHLIVHVKIQQPDT